MPGSFFSLDRHSGFFLAFFLSFLCLAADFFSIFARRRVVPRFDLGSVENQLEMMQRTTTEVVDSLFGLLIEPAIVLNEPQ